MPHIVMDLITQASRRLASGVCTNIYTAVCGGRRRHESGEKLIIHGEGGKTLESREEKETATYDTFSRRDALAKTDRKAPEQIDTEPEWVKRHSETHMTKSSTPKMRTMMTRSNRKRKMKRKWSPTI